MSRALAFALILATACSPAAPTPSPVGAATSPPPRSPAPTTASTPAPTPTAEPKVPTITDTVIQTGLAVPWDLSFAPDGRMFVTERVGNILIFESATPGARRLSNTAVPQVRAQGESGLMGIAFDPDFARTRFIYVCASRTDEGEWRNQVLRYRVDGNALTLDGVVVRAGMRAAAIHDGCRLVFGPDGKLYVSMGESGMGALAQNVTALSGKILRVNTDGSIPSDNPVLPGASGPSAIWSYGHRNPQGLAFRPGDGQLFAVEHGADDHDEINRIRPGANYGWPTQAGPGGTARGFVDPLWTSGRPTIATSGGTFVTGAQWGLWSGSLFVAQLKEQDLRRFVVTDTEATQAEVLLNGKYGRLRSPVLGPGAALYITTSNGSGDRIVRLTATQP